MSQPEVVLLFPPQWSPLQPYLSLPSLSAYLRREGIQVRQHDLNLEFYETLFSSDSFARIHAGVEDLFSYLDRKKRLDRVEQTYYYSALLIRDPLVEIAAKIEETRDFFRSEQAFFDLRKLCIERARMNTAFNAINLYYRVRFSFDDLAFDVDSESSSAVASYLEASGPGSLVRLFEEQAAQALADVSPRILGLSINNTSQVVPGLAMARWVKRHRPDIHVTLGGNLLSRCVPSLRQNPAFFRDFSDSVVVLEGEEPLLQLVRALRAGDDLSRVPNLLFSACGDKVAASPVEAPPAADSLPTPSFDGLPLDRYWSPFPILPVLASRGCYWNRCTFCDHCFVYGDNYRRRNPDLVAEDLARLGSRHGVRHFSFSDEAISPAQARRISEKIIDRRLDVRLLAQARLERAFSAEVCALMGKAGFKMLFVGLESGSPRVLESIQKGIDLAAAPSVLRRLHAAGILVHFFVLFGFPGETTADAEKTTQFVLENRSHIFSVGASALGVGKHSAVGRAPRRFGVETLDAPEKDLSFVLDFRYLTEQSRPQVEALREQFMSRCRRALDYGVVWSSMFREHFFLYALRYSEQELAQRCSSWRQWYQTNWGERHPSVGPGDALRLREGVSLIEAGFDPLACCQTLAGGSGEPLERESCFVLLDSVAQKMAKISPSGYATILLCDGTRNVADVAEKIARSRSDPPAVYREPVRSFLEDLSRRGLLVAAHQLPPASGFSAVPVHDPAVL